jgi:hypothetical protein
MKCKYLAAVLTLGLLSSSALAADDWTPEELATRLKKVEITRHALSGNRLMIGFYAALNPDCSIVDGYEYKITKEPEHGTAEFVQSANFLSFPKDNPRFKCNEKKVSGLVLTYRSNDGYAGADAFEFLDLSPGGLAREVTVHVNVRGVVARSEKVAPLPPAKVK